MGRARFALFSAVTSALIAGGACVTSSGDEVAYWDDDDGATGSGAGSPTGTGTGQGTGTGTQPVAPPNEGRDAGPDAEFTCEGLDQSEPVVLYLSADDSNSMGSPVWARERIRAGYDARDVRTYEFLNYYRIDYTAPTSQTLNLVPQFAPAAGEGEFDLQIGVRSFDAPSTRRPITLTFVLDTSGSMNGDSIERERAVVRAIATSLRAGDVVNMVTWSTVNSVVLNGHTVTGPDDPTVLTHADQLTADGGTDLHGGLVAGYQLASDHYGDSRLNRIILISDGGANVGITDEELIGEHSEDADQEGIYMVGIGTGPASGYNDTLMDTVTDAGRGAYVYIDSEQEANHLFGERFDEVMEVAARGVQVELTMPWYFEMHKFFGEEYSENPEEVTPQHLAPSDAMIFNQVLKACDPAMVNDEDVIQVKATWETPLSYNPMETSVSLTVGQLLAADSPQLRKGKAIVAYAEALKTGTESDLRAALEVVDAANGEGTDPELNEIALLIANLLP